MKDGGAREHKKGNQMVLHVNEIIIFYRSYLMHFLLILRVMSFQVVCFALASFICTVRQFLKCFGGIARSAKISFLWNSFAEVLSGRLISRSSHCDMRNGTQDKVIARSSRAGPDEDTRYS